MKNLLQNMMKIRMQNMYDTIQKYIFSTKPNGYKLGSILNFVGQVIFSRIFLSFLTYFSD